MKNATVVAAMMAMVMGLATPARADGHLAKMVVGWSAIATGGVLMATAFDYHAPSCASGESTHRYDLGQYGTTTTCVYISKSGNYSSVYDADSTATYERPHLMWAGVATMVGGAVTLAIPTRARRYAPQVGVTHGGWQVGKSISWK